NGHKPTGAPRALSPAAVSKRAWHVPPGGLEKLFFECIEFMLNANAELANMPIAAIATTNATSLLLIDLPISDPHDQERGQTAGGTRVRAAPHGSPYRLCIGSRSLNACQTPLDEGFRHRAGVISNSPE